METSKNPSHAYSLFEIQKKRKNPAVFVEMVFVRLNVDLRTQQPEKSLENVIFNGIDWLMCLK